MQRRHDTIVRRNVAADAEPTPLSVTVSLSIDGNFCTGNPEPPGLLRIAARIAAVRSPQRLRQP